MTELDKRLQEIAKENWSQFVALIGEDAIKAAKVCLLRQKNKSYGQIGNSLGLTKNQVEYACNHCPSTPE